MIIRYLRENGYQGVIPEVLLTDEVHSFTVDSKDKATGELIISNVIVK